MEGLKQDSILRWHEVAFSLVVAAIILIADAALWAWWLVDRPSFVALLADARDHVRPIWQAIPGRQEFMQTARLEANPDVAHLVGGLFLANALVLLAAFPFLTSVGLSVGGRVLRRQPDAAEEPAIRRLSWLCVAMFALVVLGLDSYASADGGFVGASSSVTYVLLLSGAGFALALTWPVSVIVMFGSFARMLRLIRETT